MSPVQTTVLIIAVVTILGVVISFMRKSSALAGYDEIKSEVPRIASAMKAEMFRDGDDVVMTGNYKGRPAMVRFSYSETTPGLNIRMQAPVSFTFSSVPKGVKATEGRVQLRTGNDMFDAKFVSRTDHPTQAKMLVGSRAALQSLEKLCCSQKTYLTMTRGSIELSELVIPTPYTSRHVLDHLEAMTIVAKTVEDIPGAENVKIEPYQREKSTPVFRLILAGAAIAAVLGVLFIRPTSTQANLNAVAKSNIATAEGVDALDAAKIGDLKGWHAMRSEEYDPDARVALRDAGFEADGSFTLDLDGDEQRDVVYALAADDGRDRVVVLRDGTVIYDTIMKNLKGALPVPKASLTDVQWRTRPRSLDADGDAILLLTQNNENVQPAIVMFSGTRVMSGIPAEWQRISFR